MLKGLAIILTYFFLLSVHGQEVVANVKFLHTEYVQYEGPADSFCITVVNDEAKDFDFRVSYTFTSNLIGTPTSGTRAATLMFAAGTVAASLCIPSIDDTIACEPDIVGTVTLINSTSVLIGKPSTATVTLKDNDPLTLSFDAGSHLYTEGNGAMENAPVVSVNTEHTRLAGPIQLMVTETRDAVLDNFVEHSLSVENPQFTLSSSQSSHSISLTISHDEVALEAPEIVSLYVAPVDPSKCFAVYISPFNTTQITVIDDNGVAVGLRDSQLSVKEDASLVEVCVTVSATLARALPFTLRTGRGTATGGGEDFTAEVFEGRFEPFSTRREICTEFTVVGDGVVELTEAFSVELSIDDNLLRQFGDRIQMTNLVTTITIVDTSLCTNIVVDSRNGTLYLPPSSSICFSCKASPDSTGVVESWFINNDQLTGEFVNGEVYSNGTLLIVNSSKLFSPSLPQLLITCSSSPTPTTNSVNALLGAPSIVYALTQNFNTMDKELEMSLTCIFRGSPRPNVTWWMDSRLIPDPANQERLSKRISVSTGEMQSVLEVKELNRGDIGRYKCVAVNQFGETFADAYLTSQQLDFYTKPTSNTHSAAVSLHVPLFINLMLTLYVLIVCTL